MMKQFSMTKFLFTLGVLFPLSMSCSANSNEVALVDNAKSGMTIVVAQDAPELTRQAAEKLVHYVGEISGAQLSIVNNLQDVKTPGILWIGASEELNKRHPKTDFTLKNPEETLIQTVGKDLVILGRDIVAKDGMQLEAGTNLAVSSFIEDQLGVRWLWPGKYGTDIPKNSTIHLKPLNIRYTPSIHFRELKWQNYMRSYNGFKKESLQQLSSYVDDPRAWAQEKDQIVREWLNNHRGDSAPTGGKKNSLAGSLWSYRNRHAFSGWYADYGKAHPEWFAMQPDGTRTPYPTAKDVKMCISNPEVAEQWVKNAKEYFEANPHATTFSTSENDHGWEGYCVCEKCLAWDNKNAEMLENNIRWENESKPFYALTDRYAKFWNIVAKRLKEEFPDRDVNVSTYAYHVTRPAPTFKLEENIIPAFVGLERRSYKRNNEEQTQDQRRMWNEWWEAVGKRDALIWRPNIIYKTLGLPYIFTKRHAANMHFLSDHGLVGLTFQDPGDHWAVQGPQLYLMAKLAWNPKADEDAILKDYYQRAFGPAAPFIEQYYQSFEDLYAKLAEQYKDQNYHVYMDPPRLFREIRQDSQLATGRLGEEGITKHYAVEKNAEILLKEATAAVAGGDSIYRERVKFVKVGFDFIQAQLDTIEANNDFSADPSEANRKRVENAAARREGILKKQVGTFALNEFRILSEIQGAARYLAPPKKKESARKETKEEKQKLIDDLEA